MNKRILFIPMSDGNTIFVTKIDFDQKKITYRRAFNPRHEITDDYEIFGEDVRTALIHFPNVWLDKWQDMNNPGIILKDELNRREKNEL